MSRPETRFAHSEGITDIALLSDAHGGVILTCGSDGDIRVWKNFDDEDPVTFSASDSCLSIFTHESTAYVGTENHTVEMFELPKGKSLGVKTKFTSGVNHIDISSDGKLLAAGAGDMTIQLISLKDSSIPTKKIEAAHRAPILSVAIDPTSKFLASSGCDGTVCVWSVTVNPSSIYAALVKKWDNVFLKSADVLLSATLCRMAWSPGQGKQLAFPNNANQILVYARDQWTQEFTLGHKCITKLVSIIRYSACGKYIAAGGADGSVLVWELATKKCVFFTNENNSITGLVLAPNNGLYMTDDRGRFIYVRNFIKSGGEAANESAEKKATTEFNGDKAADDMNDMFDDGMDEIFNLADDDDDENSISISKIKAEVGFIEDEYVGVDKAAKGIKPIEDEDSASNMSAPVAEPKVIYQAPVNPFTDPQPTFQPASTPVRLEHRFMVWNSVAIIRNYTTDDEEEAIDVEFHDASFHTAIHLRNQFSFTMAVASTEAAVFACEKGDGNPSKLFCLNFSTWDKSKEWTVDMPKGENINCIAIGKGWIAASTSLNRLRLFSVGGIQKFAYDLGNQVVTMSGYDDLLFIVSHFGVGINGNQSLSYTILKVKELRLQPLIGESPLSLTPKSVLTWIGFSDEGTPVLYDSKDMLRILNGNLWSPLCCMREHLNGPNNHFWVVGVSETSQNIRAIKCKGNKYPPAIPRPTIMLIDMKVPLCELDTEKSQLEDGVLRSNLLKSIANKLDRKGFDMDEFKDQADTVGRENLMKLFALSTKGDRDFRAAEYVSLMRSSQYVQVAIKYASKLYKMALSERLTAIGRDKLEKEDLEEVDDYDFETQNKTNYIHIRSVNPNSENDSIAQDPFSTQNSSYRNTSTSSQTQRSTFLSLDSTLADNPILKEQRDAIRAVIEPVPMIPASRNPFRKAEEHANENGNAGKGIALIDAWKKLPDKPTVEFNPKNPLRKQAGKKKADTDKDKEKVAGGGRGKRKSDKDTSDLPAESKSKKQRTLHDMHMTKAKAADQNNSNPSSPMSPAMSLDEESRQASKVSAFSDVEENGDESDAEAENAEVDHIDDNSKGSVSSDNEIQRKGKDTKASTAVEKKSQFASKLQLFAKQTDEQETY